MDGHSRKHTTQGLLYLAAVGATFSLPFTAQAAITDYECNLSGTVAGSLNGCVSGGVGGGSQTSVAAVLGYTIGSTDPAPCPSGSTMCGASSNAAAAVAPIYAWGVCRWVDKASADDFFVPFGSSYEWSQFVANKPSALTLTRCAVPYTKNGAVANTNIMSVGATTGFTANYTNCTPTYNVTNPNVYGRTGVSLYPSSPLTVGAPGVPTLTCNSGTTTIMANVQWIAGQVAEPTPTTALSWNPQFKYSPDVDFTVNTSSVTQGDSVILTWSIAPFVSGAAVSCTASSNPAAPAWGPPGSFSGNNSGSSTISLASVATYSFTLSCTESPSLTSVASASVSAVGAPPPPCCG